MNGGYIKIPRKLGSTMTVPAMYHGALLPILVLHLSLEKPTIGVVIPSAIYPESIAKPAFVAERPTTSLT
jgi:hypothetical protein